MRKVKTKKRKLLFMSKAKFNSLSPAAKRIHIAKDVITQLKIKKLKAESGTFINFSTIINSGETKLKEFMELPDTDACEVCAKGAMFMSFCGIKNKFELHDGRTKDVDMNSDSMRALSKIFPTEQLGLIETAFEGTTFGWNYISDNDSVSKAISFGKKYKKDFNRLIAICENIIKNKGTFKP